VESIFSVIIILYALLFYLINRRSIINRWCAIYVGIAAIGVIKEAFYYQIVPLLQTATPGITNGITNGTTNSEIYDGIYSIMTWIAYSFPVPAAFIMGLYFYGLNKTAPKLMNILKTTIWIFPIILSILYPPINFTEYQTGNQTFWQIYSIYNISFAVIIIALILKGISIEKQETVKRQKIILSAGTLPPMIYVIITIYVVHLFDLENWFKAWQWNVVIVAVCLIFYIIMAFRNGFIGLKLSAQVYNWDSEMNVVGKGADYTSHMLKNQTSKMELCIQQLKTQYSTEKPPEEIAILSRSVSALKDYVDRMKRHSQAIQLIQEPCRISDLLTEAISLSQLENPEITIHTDVHDNVFLVCDKGHMMEVLSNLLTNSAEAMSENGNIELSGTLEKSAYILKITDNGTGMDEEEIRNIFTPYFTTKNTERNFGLGLAYCKNVIEKHGGSISAKNNREKGMTVTIKLPRKCVAISGTD